MEDTIIQLLFWTGTIATVTAALSLVVGLLQAKSKEEQWSKRYGKGS